MSMDIVSGGAESSRPRRERRRYMWIGAIAALLLLAAIWAVGDRESRRDTSKSDDIASVHLAEGRSFQISGDTMTREAYYRFSIANNGPDRVHIESMGRSGAGLELEGVEPRRADLQSGDTINFVLRYRVSDCDAVTNSSWPLPVRVTASGRTTTEYIPMKGVGPRSQWQRDLAEAVCRPGS